MAATAIETVLATFTPIDMSYHLPDTSFARSTTRTNQNWKHSPLLRSDVLAASLRGVLAKKQNSGNRQDFLFIPAAPRRPARCIPFFIARRVRYLATPRTPGKASRRAYLFLSETWSDDPFFESYPLCSICKPCERLVAERTRKILQESRLRHGDFKPLVLAVPSALNFRTPLPAFGSREVCGTKHAKAWE